MIIGIITFHRANNYGAVLQAYALQRVLINSGFEAKIVDYESNYLKYPFAKINWKQKGLFAQILTLLGEFSRLPRRKAFDDFRKLLVCTKPVKKEDLPNIEKDFDLFVVGSDQVWNYKITNRDGSYFLDFVKDSNKKASYAASFGFTSVDSSLIEWYKSMLTNFNYLNVREKSSLPLLKKITNQYGNIVLDPTLLLTKKDWLDLAVFPSETKPYILTYQVGMDKELISFVRRLAKKTGYKIYSIPFPQGGIIKSRFIMNAGPKEWLGWIANAQYVITDSFHGVALSIALEKEFFVHHNIRGAVLSSRINDLMNELGIQNHILSFNNDERLPEEIDYSIITSNLQNIKINSMNVISEMCGER